MADKSFLYPGLSWGLKSPQQAPRFEGYDVSSIYIPMRDGVRLAADVFLPKGLEPGSRLPSLLYRTRYWRDVELRVPGEEVDAIIQYFTANGYAVVRVDVRGTGASFGGMLYEWQRQDTEDAYDLVEWMVAQPWCSGQVGAYGGSYAGTTAVLLTETGHPAVTSIWGTCFEFDGYTDIVLPGGIPSKFIDMWGQYTTMLDENLALDDNGNPDPHVVGVKPVDADTDHTLLETAVQQHAQNNHADQLMANVTFRDDEMLPGVSVEEMAVYGRLEKLVQSGVPMDIWGSWLDANTPDTVLRFFVNNPHVRRAVIGAWSHSGLRYCSPYAPQDAPHEMPFEVQLNEISRFMDENFHPQPEGTRQRGVYYFTMGEEKWKFTPTWPPENITAQRWYLRAGNLLSSEIPQEAQAQSDYQVDFSAATGMQNRWWTEMGGAPVVYPDRAQQDQKLLVFDSPPLERDVEITGYPLVSLYLSATEKDCAVFAYLEDIDADGKVIYITEGMLRALHRKVSTDRPPYQGFGPYHSFRRKDGEWLQPGQIVEMTFTLIPTSARVRKGHRLRLAIAGADESTFHRLPAQGDPLISVFHNVSQVSSLELPVVGK